MRSPVSISPLSEIHKIGEARPIGSVIGLLRSLSFVRSCQSFNNYRQGLQTAMTDSHPTQIETAKTQVETASSIPPDYPTKAMWIPGLTLNASVRWADEASFQNGDACISMC